MSEPMSEPTNGDGIKTEIITVGRRGKKTLRFAKDEPAFTIDVTQVMSTWGELDRQFRDQEGKIPPDKIHAVNVAAYQFVRGLVVNLTYPGMTKDDEKKRADYSAELDKKQSVADALSFLKIVRDESDALLPFFQPKSETTPSSRESTELIFSDKE